LREKEEEGGVEEEKGIRLRARKGGRGCELKRRKALG
jgi:hypothetical protein